MARTNETIKRGPRGATTQQWMYQCRNQTEVRHKDNTYRKNKLASCKMILQILIVQTVYSQHTAHSETFKQGHLACNLITEHLPFNVNVILSTYIKYSAGFFPLRSLLCFELKTIVWIQHCKATCTSLAATNRTPFKRFILFPITHLVG